MYNPTMFPNTTSNCQVIRRQHELHLGSILPTAPSKEEAPSEGSVDKAVFDNGINDPFAFSDNRRKCPMP